MACGEVDDVDVTTWHWCTKWGFIPWRCKKTVTQRRYVYDFAILRRRDRWFTATYRACCEAGGGEFRWTEGTWHIYWNPPDEQNAHRTFETPLTSIGPCTLSVPLTGSASSQAAE
jgi:hypothetical protein